MHDSSDRAVLKDSVFLLIAKDLSTLGTCDRNRVGAVIVRDGRCITWGFNGAPPGLPHCEESGHGYIKDGYVEHWREVGGQDEVSRISIEPLESGVALMLAADTAKRWGCANSTHAEANALAFAARQGISTDGGTLYVTVSPCVDCARLLIAAGIKRVVFDRAYRDSSGLELLHAGGVQVA